MTTGDHETVHDISIRGWTLTTAVKKVNQYTYFNITNKKYAKNSLPISTDFLFSSL